MYNICLPKKIDLARWGWCSLSINTQDKHRDYDQCPHSDFLKLTPPPPKKKYYLIYMLFDVSDITKNSTAMNPNILENIILIYRPFYTFNFIFYFLIVLFLFLKNQQT